MSDTRTIQQAQTAQALLTVIENLTDDLRCLAQSPRTKVVANGTTEDDQTAALAVVYLKESATLVSVANHLTGVRGELATTLARVAEIFADERYKAEMKRLSFEADRNQPF